MKKVSISMMAALLALAGQRGGISSFANKIYLTATGQMKQK